MKRILALVLSLAMLLTGCANPQSASSDTVGDTTTEAPADEVVSENIKPQFDALDDADLLTHVEELVYRETVRSLDSEEYLVENVSAVYISKEYLDEVAFNSQSNIYFGYTLAELDELFQGSRYIFTLGENGQTTVQELQKIDDTSAETMLTNVAIGTGVILVCVTVSVISGGAGVPAVSIIFAASAKTGTVFALSSGAFSTLVAGFVTGYQTKDFDEAMKAATLAGSEGFKWGAIAGVFDGGITQTLALKGATLNGLTMNEAALIQKESGLPLAFIKSFHSMDEYMVYKNSGLQLTKVNGQWAYTQAIDWDFISDAQGRTNAQRVADGLAPLDPTGKSYELHHVGQMADSPLAIMTNDQHHGNYSILHANTGAQASNIDRTAFNSQKKEFWSAFLTMTQNAN